MSIETQRKVNSPGYFAGLRGLTDSRKELLDLARDIVAGETRRAAANELVPLLASPVCFDAIGVFLCLTEAVADEEWTEVGRLLDMLTQRQALA